MRSSCKRRLLCHPCCSKATAPVAHLPQVEASASWLLHVKSQISYAVMSWCRAYDPHAFSLADTQKAVKAAFRSKASVSQGSKLFSVSHPAWLVHVPGRPRHKMLPMLSPGLFHVKLPAVAHMQGYLHVPLHYSWPSAARSRLMLMQVMPCAGSPDTRPSGPQLPSTIRRQDPDLSRTVW